MPKETTMNDQRQDMQNWDHLSPEQVLNILVYEIYSPVSSLGSQLKRLTADDDPLTEEDYEQIFAQMDAAVRQLSKTVVHLKQYTKSHPA
jgi:hypothetical protein